MDLDRLPPDVRARVEAALAAPRKKPRVRFAWLGVLLAAMVLPLMCGGVVAAIFPGVLRATTPLVCPRGTMNSLVVREVRSSAGKTSVTGVLVCEQANGRLVRAGGGRSLLTFAGMLAAPLWALLALGVVRARLRRRRAS